MIADELLGALQAAAPGVAAALVLVGTLGARATGAALALGLWATHAYLMAVPEWPYALLTGNNDGKQWLVWSVLLAAIVALLPRRIGHWSSPLVLGAGVWLMLTNLRARAGAAESATTIALASGAWIALWAATRPLLVRRPGILVPLAFAAAFGLDGWLLLLSGSAFLGQLAGACSAALGTAAGIAWLRRGSVFAQELALPLALAHGGLLLAGHQFAELGLATAILALCAPCAAWALILVMERGRDPSHHAPPYAPPP